MGGVVAPAVHGRCEVARLVFLCAVLPDWFRPAATPEGLELQLIDPSQMGADELGRATITPAGARAHLYADWAPDDADRAIARLRPQSLEWMAGPPPSGVIEVPMSWIAFSDDRTIDPEWQRPGQRSGSASSPTYCPADTHRS